MGDASWIGLLDISDLIPDGWTLIGGQLVHLHCFERNIFPTRPTTDIDTALDIRTYPEMLLTFTKTLKDLGFSSPLTNQGGHQYRWIREDAVIDLLIPTNLGDRSSARKGVTGSTTISTLGAQGALNRSEKVLIKIGPRLGIINRPHLMGSIIMKSGAFSNFQDQARDRHLMDLLTLFSLIEINDEKDIKITHEERKRINLVITAIQDNPFILNTVEGGREALDRFKFLFNAN